MLCPVVATLYTHTKCLMGVCMVNCTRHAVHLHSSRKVTPFQEETQQRSPVYPSSPDRDNPNGHPILSSRHRRLGQSDQGKSSQSASPNADTATPFPAPASHGSSLRILHRRILGIFPLTFTSSRVTFTMYPPIHPCCSAAYYDGDCHKRACIHACACR